MAIYGVSNFPGPLPEERDGVALATSRRGIWNAAGEETTGPRSRSVWVNDRSLSGLKVLGFPLRNDASVARKLGLRCQEGPRTGLPVAKHHLQAAWLLLVLLLQSCRKHRTSKRSFLVHPERGQPGA